MKIGHGGLNTQTPTPFKLKKSKCNKFAVPLLELATFRITNAAGKGDRFGLVTYATYDLTNLATVRDWPLVVTLADLAWGMILTTTVSLAGFFAGKRMA